MTLELGGNDAAIVMDDVDPKMVAKKVYDGAMANAGQICVAIKRAYVPSGMYDEFCEELATLAKAAVVDDGMKQGAEIGPVQNKMQYEKLKGMLAEAREQGTILAGGDAIDRPGYFIAPTIVRDLPETARLVQEEQFGPVLPVLKYDDIEDVIARANDSIYGLAGTVWGKDLAKATDIAMRIDSGTVWVNQHLAIDANIPFRGSKESGMGAELGQAGLHEYTQAHIVNAVELA
ncbi:MAG: aldehyde dehydrogenase family protein [Caulobacteraceae bacterium]